MLESPGLCILDIKDDFIWGDDLMQTQYDCIVPPVFKVDLLMNSNGAYYSTKLEAFKVIIYKILIFEVLKFVSFIYNFRNLSYLFLIIRCHCAIK